MLQRRGFMAGTAGTLALGSALGGFRPAFAQGATPDYYPESYKDLVEASRKEQGLLIYSNMAEYNWKPVIAGFNKAYPWIQVSTLDLSSELFERYLAEKSSRTRTTDLIVNGAIDQWIEFVDRGEIEVYESPEATKLPDWSKPFPGLYTASCDPMIIAYNKMLLPEAQAPKSIAQLAELATSQEGMLNNRISTYNAATNTFGLSIFWAYMAQHGDAWDKMARIGALTRPERSAGPIVEKITTGEYMLGFFVSGIVLFPKLADPARASLLGWSFIEDGNPLFMRGMAVTKGASSPNSAKLMLDYVLSRAGQTAFGQGGLTPYRPDVPKADVPFQTYESAVQGSGGPDKTVLVKYDREMVTNRSAFIERWKQAFPRG